MAFFDNIQDTAFNIIKNTFGDVATWEPSEGGDTLEALVLLNEPTEKETLFDNQDYNPDTVSVEYKKGDFEGLYEAYKNGLDEQLEISIRGGLVTFLIRLIERKYDGDTYVAFLEPV